MAPCFSGGTPFRSPEPAYPLYGRNGSEGERKRRFNFQREVPNQTPFSHRKTAQPLQGRPNLLAELFKYNNSVQTRQQVRPESQVTFANLRFPTPFAGSWLGLEARIRPILGTPPVELLLNLAWLLVTVVCSTALLVRLRRSTDSQPVWVLVTAVVCVMVLLFPVISMTDDLHAEVFTAEESGKRRAAAVHLLELVAFVHVLAAWLLIAIAAPLSTGWTLRCDDFAPRPLEGTRTASLIRPPPSLVLA